MGTMQGHFFIRLRKITVFQLAGGAVGLLVDGSPGGPTLPSDTFAVQLPADDEPLQHLRSG